MDFSSDALFTSRFQHSRLDKFARFASFFLFVVRILVLSELKKFDNFFFVNTNLRLRLLLMSIPQFELKKSNISSDAEVKIQQRGFILFKCCRVRLKAWGKLNAWISKCDLFLFLNLNSSFTLEVWLFFEFSVTKVSCNSVVWALPYRTPADGRKKYPRHYNGTFASCMA